MEVNRLENGFEGYEQCPGRYTAWGEIMKIWIWTMDAKWTPGLIALEQYFRTCCGKQKVAVDWESWVLFLRESEVIKEYWDKKREN